MKKSTTKRLLTRQGFYPVPSHTEEIICPECGKRQTAIVEHTLPWATYVHRCRRCKYTICESEWSKAPEVKRHDQIRKRLFAITKGTHLEFMDINNSQYCCASYQFEHFKRQYPKPNWLKRNSRLARRKDWIRYGGYERKIYISFDFANNAGFTGMTFLHEGKIISANAKQINYDDKK